MPPESRIHKISDRYVEDSARLNPIGATYVGIDGYEDQLTDFTPDAVRARGELLATAVREIEAQTPADDVERVAQAVFVERGRAELALHDADLVIADLNVIESPVQDTRMVFDLMAGETAEDWAQVASRLAKVPDTVAGIRAALAHGADHDRVAALRQVTKTAEQCAMWAGRAPGEPSFFATLIAGARNVPCMTDALRTDLEAGAVAAATAYGDLGDFLVRELAPKAPAKDAVGPQVYPLRLKFFTGATVDLAELYQWGWDEFFRIETEMKQIAERIKPGATLAEAAAALDADPRYRLTGADALQQWMQGLSDEALQALRGKHFNLPDPLLNLECRIAPPGGGAGAYYTGPNADFTRPGRMWWSLVPGQEDFSTWREKTTVYHEGVPGHHLQIATAVYQAETLNRFQRLIAGTSGHAEGWALYAERLMRELGYLSDDGDLMGMLDAHLFRAGRVIIDLGMHLELEIPKGTGFHEGERWTPELGLEFMITRTITDPGGLPDEVDRYLGWAGQAPAYKLGERYWLAARDDARLRDPDNFDLKAFHQRALEMGSMGLDTLRERLAAL
jgi:uncharacterized protein (DUF885 family)